MPFNLLDFVKEQIVEKNVDTTTAFGRAWLLEKMRKLTPGPRDRMDLLWDRERQRNQSILGRFYFFGYYAKTRAILPYWDRFPMSVPIMQYNDGFLGLNLHYIYPKDRLIFLTQLRKFASGPLTDERTRLRLTYPLLKAAHILYRGTPCIKRYLSSHILTHFIEVPPTEWDIAASLPVQDFAAIRKEEVWKESREQEFARSARKRKDAIKKQQAQQEQ